MGRDIPAFTDLNCEKSLYGECAGESYQCKLATAHALRNRATLSGVYGYNSKLLKERISKRAWNDCVMAWKNSLVTPDITKGAKFWGCKSDLPEHYLKGMICTAHVGGHWFFKEKRKT